MITYSEVVSIIHDSSTFQVDTIVTRKLEQALEKNLLQKKPIKVITGIRRSGKSFILKRIYQQLTASVPRRNNLFTHLCLDSRKLENLIYIHLIDRYGKASVNFLRNDRGGEVDFIVTRGGAYYCFQVCVELNEENRSREFRSLINLMKYRSSEELSSDTRLHKADPPGIELIETLEFLLLE